MRALAAFFTALALCGHALAAPRCLSDCTPRIGLVSAFGAEADILLAQTTAKRVWTINGKRFTTGTLRGHRVVIVLSGVSMINATLTTQQLIDHFRIERLVMSGIAGGVNPAHHVGDVTVPDRWAMPMEVYWNADGQTPAPCGAPRDVGCLGLALADAPPFQGWFLRQNHVLTSANAPQGEFRLDYPVDPAMLQVARGLQPALARCGPNGARQCVSEQPRLIVGGRGVSGTAFLADPAYRRYLSEALQAETVDMETAALAHVAYSNGVPYIAFRSLSDLAGATGFNADVGALFASGLAEANEAAVTLAFLAAWKRRPKP
ncbi:5'-methylthioadenosine/S-adenosylhomocysteine nucleosidase [Sphaerotilaceae bacterium SBD11-9]